MEESMKISNFIFGYVSGIYYLCHNATRNQGGLYIESPKWLKKTKATIKSKK